MSRVDLANAAAAAGAALSIMAIGCAVAGDTDRGRWPLAAALAAIITSAVLAGHLRWPDGGGGAEVVDLAAWRAAA